MSDGKERILRFGFAEGPGERPQRRSLRRRFDEEPRVRGRRSMPEGEETSEKP
jgi:hypothetical protein